MADEQHSIGKILGASLVVVLFLVVAYFAFNQIPHSERPTLQPKTSVVATTPGN